MCRKCVDMRNRAAIMGLEGDYSPCFKVDKPGVEECGFWGLDD